MFEKQPRWSFPQLQKDTHQPTQHLKEVLGEIAVKNLRGPYKDLWELKKGEGRGNKSWGGVGVVAMLSATACMYKLFDVQARSHNVAEWLVSLRLRMQSTRRAARSSSKSRRSSTAAGASSLAPRETA